jgi:hypothetical protein
MHLKMQGKPTAIARDERQPLKTNSKQELCQISRNIFRCCMAHSEATRGQHFVTLWNKVCQTGQNLNSWKMLASYVISHNRCHAPGKGSRHMLHSITLTYCVQEWFPPYASSAGSS